MIDSDRPSGHDADAGRGDEDAVAFAAVHDLGIAGDEGDARLGAGLPHRGDDALEVGHRQPFFENERRREVTAAVAPPTARSLTVPWTASLPMSPPGKNSGRTTKESVVIASRGAAHSVAAGEPDGRLIFQGGEHGVTEARHEQPLRSIRSVSSPPLPWPSRIRSYCDCGQRTGAECVGEPCHQWVPPAIAGGNAGWPIGSASEPARQSSFKVAAVCVIGGAGPFRGNHGRSQRRLRRALPCRTPGNRAASSAP